MYPQSIHRYNPMIVQTWVKTSQSHWQDYRDHGRKELGTNHPLLLKRGVKPPLYHDLVVPKLPPQWVRVYFVQHDHVRNSPMDLGKMTHSTGGSTWKMIEKNEFKDFDQLFSHISFLPGHLDDSDFEDPEKDTFSGIYVEKKDGEAHGTSERPYLNRDCYVQTWSRDGQFVLQTRWEDGRPPQVLLAEAGSGRLVLRYIENQLEYSDIDLEKARMSSKASDYKKLHKIYFGQNAEVLIINGHPFWLIEGTIDETEDALTSDKREESETEDKYTNNGKDKDDEGNAEDYNEEEDKGKGKDKDDEDDEGDDEYDDEDDAEEEGKDDEDDEDEEKDKGKDKDKDDEDDDEDDDDEADEDEDKPCNSHKASKVASKEVTIVFINHEPNQQQPSRIQVPRNSETYTLPSIFIHDQLGPTCYTYAWSGAIAAATDRVCYRTGGYPKREDVLRELLTFHHSNSAKWPKIVANCRNLCRKYRLRTSIYEFDEFQNIIEGVCAGRKMVFNFGLPCQKDWDLFSTNRVMRRSTFLPPKKIYKGDPPHLERDTGHSVLLIGYIPDMKQPGKGKLVFDNSWGTDWGKTGKFELEVDQTTDEDFFVNFLMFNVVDIYWTEEDLTEDEKTRFEKSEKERIQRQRQLENTPGKTRRQGTQSTNQRAPSKKVKPENFARCDGCAQAQEVLHPHQRRNMCRACLRIQTCDCNIDSECQNKCLACKIHFRILKGGPQFLQYKLCFYCVRKQAEAFTLPTHIWVLSREVRMESPKIKFWTDKILSDLNTIHIPFVGKQSVSELQKWNIGTVAQLIHHLGIKLVQPVPSQIHEWHKTLAELRRFIPLKVDTNNILKLLCYKAWRMHTLYLIQNNLL